MIKKIVEGYGSLFSSVGKILSLLIVCAIVGATFVFPLWKFATDAPKIYTIVIFSIIVAGIIFFFVKKARTSGIKKVLSAISRFLIILVGISFCIFFVLNGKRILAIPTLIVMLILYGIASFGFKKQNDIQK